MLTVRGLKKYYVSGLIRKRVTKAVNGVDLSVAKKRIYGLTGESGCGKTTLAMLILGLIKPTAGTISIDKKTITAIKSRALRKGGRDFRPSGKTLRPP